MNPGEDIPIRCGMNRSVAGFPRCDVMHVGPEGGGEEEKRQGGGSAELLHWAPPMVWETLEVYMWSGTEVVHVNLCGVAWW